MKVVGLRELKNRLSEYVRQVRGGEVVLVTDRGIVVAELRPPGETRPPQADVLSGLVELAKQGALSLGSPSDAASYPPLPPRLPSRVARDLLDEERGAR